MEVIEEGGLEPSGGGGGRGFHPLESSEVSGELGGQSGEVLLGGVTRSPKAALLGRVGPQEALRGVVGLDLRLRLR